MKKKESLLAHLILSFFSLLILLPIIWILRTSLVDKLTAYKIPPSFEKFDLSNYFEIFINYPFASYFFNSVIVALGTTILNSGVKLDNQVHIAHNCNIGKNTIIGAKTAIAGSTTIGEDCLIGGGCGIVDNIKIENGVRVNPMSYVTRSIKKPGIYSGGSVVLEHSKWLKHITIQKKVLED